MHSNSIQISSEQYGAFISITNKQASFVKNDNTYIFLLEQSHLCSILSFQLSQFWLLASIREMPDLLPSLGGVR